MWDKIRDFLGLTDQDPYVKDYIEGTNMQSMKYMCTFVIFVESWMILRTIKSRYLGANQGLLNGSWSI